jgi:peptide deformylase
MPFQIAQLGQPVLREPARPVDAADIATSAFQQFLDEMLETLAGAGGVGLAAPQVFDGRRVFLAAVLRPADEDAPPGVEFFVNPRIVGASLEKGTAWEGCLSFPELLVMVERPLAVRVEYLDRQGGTRTLELQGFPARVIQHETDHLNGILTLDRAVSTRHIIKASEIDAVKKPPTP